MSAEQRDSVLAAPELGRSAAEAWVATHLTGLYEGAPVGSQRFRGGQAAADSALAAYDVSGYAGRRNEVAPVSKRGASALSPYIRHGLIDLPTAWQHVAGGPARDVRKFRDELLWQEFARHWYARLGRGTRRGLRRELKRPEPMELSVDVWDRSMVCFDETIGELTADGWLVNQTRMWLASHWTVRNGRRWRDGENAFFQHLLDGSRAANRLGWQWTTGVGSSKHYGFSRWQVEKRAPGWCGRCTHRDDCPIEDWPDDPEYVPSERPEALRRGSSQPDLAGPSAPIVHGDPDAVWLTAESLGIDDPAAAAHPGLPLVFVFDEPLLRSLQLSAKRLVFLVETLAELAGARPLELYRGRPDEVLGGRRLAVTHAPVPGFDRLRQPIEPVAVYPWRWLVEPHDGNVSSFSAWRKAGRLNVLS